MLSDMVQITVLSVDHENDRVTIMYQDPDSGEFVEKEMSLKYFVELLNSDPKAKLEKPVLN